MRVVHPSYLGRIVNQEIKDMNLPYAIFAGDNHGSHTAQQNIARIYEYYARNNGLTLVGCEGIGEDGFYMPTDKSAISRLEKKIHRELTTNLKRKAVNGLVRPRPNDDYGKNIYHTYIREIAMLFGYELELFEISPHNRIQQVKEVLRSTIGKVTTEEGMRRFFEELESPEVSLEMIETFTEKFLHSDKRIAMFITGSGHIDHINERLPQLPFNYVLINPKGIETFDPWLEEMYLDWHIPQL